MQSHAVDIIIILIYALPQIKDILANFMPTLSKVYLIDNIFARLDFQFQVDTLELKVVLCST